MQSLRDKFTQKASKEKIVNRGSGILGESLEMEIDQTFHTHEEGLEFQLRIVRKKSKTNSYGFEKKIVRKWGEKIGPELKLTILHKVYVTKNSYKEISLLKKVSQQAVSKIVKAFTANENYLDELIEEIDAKADMSEIVAELVNVFELEKRKITSV